MTLTNPEWYLSVNNFYKGWTYETFPGDLNPPYGDVWISAENFGLSWGFSGETSPGPLDPKTVQIALSCTTAADVPDIDYGDTLFVEFWRPDGPISRDPVTGVVTADLGDFLVQTSFWVTDIVSVESRGRMLLMITATKAPVDATIDVRGYLNEKAAQGYPNTQNWQTWAEYLPTINPTYSDYPYPSRPLVELTPTRGPVEMWYLIDITLAGHLGVGIKLDDEVNLIDLLDGAHAAWFAPPGWDGRQRGCAFVWELEGGTDDQRDLVSLPWDPEANAPHAAAYELTFVGSVVDAELLGSFTPAAAGSTLGIIDASLIVAAPDWRKDAASGVGLAEYSGHSRTSSTDDSTDTDVTIQSVDMDGSAVRSTESKGYLRNTVTPALDFDTSGSRFTADTINLATKAGVANGWVPDRFEIRPRYMTDAQWAALCQMFWPNDEYQRTLVIVNIDPDDDMAGGRPVFLTMMGADLTISNGHLAISPRCRPFAPAAINGITDGVTWAQMNSTHPTAKWSHAAPGLTWAQIALTSI